MPSNPKPSSGVWISSAYRGLTVVMIPREHDTALEETNPGPILQRIHAHQIPPEPEPRQPTGVEYALIGEIVNREDRCRSIRPLPGGEPSAAP